MRLVAVEAEGNKDGVGGSGGGRSPSTFPSQVSEGSSTRGSADFLWKRPNSEYLMFCRYAGKRYHSRPDAALQEAWLALVPGNSTSTFPMMPSDAVVRMPGALSAAGPACLDCPCKQCTLQ